MRVDGGWGLLGCCIRPIKTNGRVLNELEQKVKKKKKKKEGVDGESGSKAQPRRETVICVMEHTPPPRHTHSRHIYCQYQCTASSSVSGVLCVCVSFYCSRSNWWFQLGNLPHPLIKAQILQRFLN